MYKELEKLNKWRYINWKKYFKFNKRKSKKNQNNNISTINFGEYENK